MVIGLCGRKRSGKTTIAKYLQEKYKFARANFATPIYMMNELLLRYQGLSEERIQYLVHGAGRDTEIVPELGWKTCRYFQQTIGTDWGRGCMHDSLWVNACISTGIFSNENVVVENVRFLEEADRIRKLGGLIIRIIRPDNDNEDQHRSEQESETIITDFVINNDSTIEMLCKNTKLFIRSKQWRRTKQC